MKRASATNCRSLEPHAISAETLSVRRLLIGTNNPGKVREFRRLLADSGFDVVTPADLGIAIDVEETGTTYAENAAIKARAFAAASGCLAMADDSGIEVDALDGRPGVYSARYGGPGLDDAGRTNLLLKDLGDTPAEKRTGRYRAVVAVAEPGGEATCFEGVQEGCIDVAWRGERGFGYDPIFIAMPDGRTNAEISDEEKDVISHRGKAIRAAIAWLRGDA